MPSVTQTRTQTLTVAPGKGERTRQRLLEIAVRRFAADGFRRTSVSDIARAAGLTPAAAYAYFAGKEGLFQAAVDADAAALIEVARSDALGGGSARERLFVFVTALRAAILQPSGSFTRWRAASSRDSSPRSPPVW